jgi:hypothetical protein
MNEIAWLAEEKIPLPGQSIPSQSNFSSVIAVSPGISGQR